MKVYLIGVGMGNPDTLTGEARRAIEESRVLLGAPRLVEPWSGERSVHPLIRPQEILAALEGERDGPAAVLLSGDTGFYSGAKALWPLLARYIPFRASPLSLTSAPGSTPPGRTSTG